MATLTELQTAVTREADLSGIVDAADLTAVINEECAAVHELLVMSFQDYSVTSAPVTVLANTDSIALPATTYKVRGVEDDSADDYPLPRFNWEDRKRVGTLSYCVLGTNLIVRPTQTANRTYNVWYVPQYTVLSAGENAFSPPNQWHMLAVLNAAARFKDIQGLDSSALVARADKVRKRIEMAASQRDAGDPGKARDVRNGRRKFKQLENLDPELF